MSRIRRTLYNRCHIARGANLLVAFSGGHSSSALSYAIHDIIKQNTWVKVFSLTLVHVDQTRVSPKFNPDESERFLTQVREQMEWFGCPHHIVSLEQLFEGHSTIAMQSLFQTLESDSAREDMLQNLREQLLVQFARDNQFPFLLLGDSCTRLAIRTLGNTAKGRGRGLPLELAFSRLYEEEGVTLVRPMKEVLDKEAAIMMRLVGMKCGSCRTFSTATDLHSTIDRIAETFVLRVQRDYPSTVHTILRSADRLKFSGKDPATCPLCRSPMPPSELDLARDSHQQGHPLSTFVCMCYSCRRNLGSVHEHLLEGLAESSGDVQDPLDEMLPSYVVQRRQLNEDQLRSQLQGFLLEDLREDQEEGDQSAARCDSSTPPSDPS